MANTIPPKFVRGASIQFSTTFTDFGGAIIVPGNATLYITYPTEAGGVETTTIDMTAPVSPSTIWTAVWDTRGAGEGAAQWFIQSDPGPPFAAGQGELVLTANSANPANFT